MRLVVDRRTPDRGSILPASPPPRASRGRNVARGPWPVAQARTIVLWALTAAVVVLAATGVALYFAYRPDSAASWPDVSGPLWNDITFGSVVRDVHGWAAWLALPTAVVAGVPLARRARPTERVAPGLATGVGLVLVVVAASVTGYLLPWDQLALFAVTVGTNISGYTWLRDGSVRFVLIGRHRDRPGDAVQVAAAARRGPRWRPRRLSGGGAAAGAGRRRRCAARARRDDQRRGARRGLSPRRRARGAGGTRDEGISEWEASSRPQRRPQRHSLPRTRNRRP